MKREREKERERERREYGGEVCSVCEREGDMENKAGGSEGVWTC